MVGRNEGGRKEEMKGRKERKTINMYGKRKERINGEKRNEQEEMKRKIK